MTRYSYFEYYIKNASDWANQTFGPGIRDEGIIDHIRKELKEIEEADNNQDRIEEWIDVVILACDALQRHGYGGQEIEDHLNDKLARNKLRQWPDWRTAEAGKAIEHIRT